MVSKKDNRIFASEKTEELIMVYKNITDISFVPSEHYQIEAYHEVYQIVYGVLYKTPNFDRVHNIIVHLAKATASTLSLKTKLFVWSMEIDRIIKKLKSYQKNNVHVEVIVPITSYYASLEATIVQYEFAKATTQELSNDLSLLDNEQIEDNVIQIPSMYMMFADYILDFQESYIDESFVSSDGAVVGDTTRDYYSIIFDEMLRRGLRNEKVLYECPSLKMIPNLPPFIPSTNYSNEDLFLELFMNKEDVLNEIELPSATGEAEEVNKIEDNKKVKCGVLYYLLKDHLDDYSLSALINYCCNTIYNKRIKKKNNNSIDKYIRLFKKRDISPSAFESFDLKPEVIDNIKKVLGEYELSIPSVLYDE